MRLRPRKLILPAIAVLVVLALILLSALKRTVVDIAVIDRGTVRHAVEEEGETRVIDRFVLAAPTSGRLLRVTVEEGDAVQRGDVLAEIDPLPLKSRVTAAEARIRALRHQIEGVERKRPKAEAVARAGLLVNRAEEAKAVAERNVAEAGATTEKAGRDADRARSLQSEGTITTAEREAAELLEQSSAEAFKAAGLTLKIRVIEVATAKLTEKLLIDSAEDLEWEEAYYKAQVEGVEAELEAVRDDLGRAKLTAPADGVVLERFLESETPVAAGAPVLSVGDPAQLEATADVLSEDASLMREGMTVEIFGRALGTKVLRGRLQRIHPSAFTKISSLGVEQQRVAIVTTFDSTGSGLRDRFRIDIRVILEERPKALRVPEGALFRHDGEWHVFRVEAGKSRLTRVATAIRDGRHREVTDGLAEGDEVVLHPPDDIEDGTRIEPRGR